jgi:hypothetical protein
MTLFHGRASETVSKVVTAGVRATEAACGAQSEYGRFRHLLADICGQGLTDVEAVGRVVMMRGGSPLCTHLRLSRRLGGGYPRRLRHEVPARVARYCGLILPSRLR